MATSDKRSEAAKVPANFQTISLKVFIHCEGCKKKVKKILQQIDGVTTVDVDAELGTVTVTGTGTLDSRVLLKKLEKAGKVAEVLVAATAGGGNRGKEQQNDQPKGEKKEVKKVRFEEGDSKDKKGKGVGEGSRKGGSSGGSDYNLNDASNEESAKKKRVGDGHLDDASSSKNFVHRVITPRMIETSYSVESADYATHMFSDENTDSCHIM